MSAVETLCGEWLWGAGAHPPARRRGGSRFLRQRTTSPSCWFSKARAPHTSPDTPERLAIGGFDKRPPDSGADGRGFSDILGHARGINPNRLPLSKETEAQLYRAVFLSSPPSHMPLLTGHACLLSYSAPNPAHLRRAPSCPRRRGTFLPYGCGFPKELPNPGEPSLLTTREHCGSDGWTK